MLRAAALLLLVAAPGGARLTLDAGRLGELPAGAVVHRSVRATTDQPPAIAFGEGGLTVPIADHLTPAVGTVDVAFTLPAAWPPAADATLFHLGREAHVHVTLFFRNGGLVAVYKGGEAHYASLNANQTRGWAPASRHRIVLTWQAVGEQVPFWLFVDDRLVGSAEGRLINRWPTDFDLGHRAGRAPWPGLVHTLALAAERASLPALEAGRHTIRVEAGREIGACYPFWTIGNATTQDSFATPQGIAQTRASRPFLTQINCVRLLGGRTQREYRLYLGPRPDGTAECDFGPMVTNLRGLVNAGYTPRIVLDNVPWEMARTIEENEYGNTHPPQDYRLWNSFITQAIEALFTVAGRDVASRWRFRVGTEPDLHPGHWAGTKDEYLRHYDETVATVLRLIPDADIGPGNVLDPGHGRWGLDLVDHCARTGTRMTFLSCSWYGRVGQPHDGFEAAIGAMRARLAKYPALASLPVEVAEFGVLHDERGGRLWGGESSEWAASWYAAIADQVYRLGVPWVHEWAQVAAAGLPQARTHVLAMLDQMAGGRRLATATQSAGAAQVGCLAVRQGEALDLLLYHHRPQREAAVTDEVVVTIRDPRFRAGTPWRRSDWLVDRDHGVFIRQFEADCLAAGLTPLPQTGRFEGAVSHRWGREGATLLGTNRAIYQRLAALPQVLDREPTAVGDGTLMLRLELPCHSVRRVRLEPPAAP